MSFGVKLGALAWARDNTHACHLISRGEANLYISPPPLKLRLRRGCWGGAGCRWNLFGGHLGVRQQPMWGEAGLLSCAHGRAPECRVSRVLLVIMRLPPSENRDSPPRPPPAPSLLLAHISPQRHTQQEEVAHGCCDLQEARVAFLVVQIL